MSDPNRYIAVAFLFGIAYVNSGVALAVHACSRKVLDDVLVPAAAPGDSVTIDCNLTLQPNHVITKRLILEGLASSGVTVDCNNAKLNGGRGTPNFRDDMIQVRSKMNPDGSWERPVDVVIRKCRIDGSARVMGMTSTADLILSSRTSDHTERMRNIAPTRVRFEQHHDCRRRPQSVLCWKWRDSHAAPQLENTGQIRRGRRVPRCRIGLQHDQGQPHRGLRIARRAGNRWLQPQQDP